MKDFRIAVKSFILDGDNLLLMKRTSKDVQRPGIWEIPGGRLNPGEDPFEGIKRETKEETGLDIEVLHPLSVRHFVRDDHQTITMINFLCKALNRDVKMSKEHSDFDWVNADNCKGKLTGFFHKEADVIKKVKHLF